MRSTELPVSLPAMGHPGRANAESPLRTVAGAHFALREAEILATRVLAPVPEGPSMPAYEELLKLAGALLRVHDPEP
jgi:hypothetical protein